MYRSSMILIDFIRLGNRANKRFNKRPFTEILKKEILCANCGNLMPEWKNICSACHSEQIMCPICLGPIIFGETIIKCSNCGVFSHEDHYIQWVTTKGYCPKCKTKIKDLD